MSFQRSGFMPALPFSAFENSSQCFSREKLAVESGDPFSVTGAEKIAETGGIMNRLMLAATCHQNLHRRIIRILGGESRMTDPDTEILHQETPKALNPKAIQSPQESLKPCRTPLRRNSRKHHLDKSGDALRGVVAALLWV